MSRASLARRAGRDPLKKAALEQAERLSDLADLCADLRGRSQMHRDIQEYAALELGARRQLLACLRIMGRKS